VTVRYTEQPERSLAPVGEAAFHQWVFPDGTLWTQFFRQGAGYLLRFPELADFEVSADGCTVQGFPAHGVSSPTVEHLYLNQVMPLALSRQGKLVLHGSAVDIGGQGVAFLGESGRGKSTLAASFATAGTRFLTDDGLLLEWVEGCCMVIPSHPSIRLWEDSQDALVSEGAAMAPAVSFTSKSRFLAGPSIAFCDEARILRRVFFLGEGDVETTIIEPLRPAEALIELVKHSFLLDIEARDMLARHFDDLSRLAALPIYYRLDYPRSYEDLPAVREAVIRHALEHNEGIEHEFV
jgi:hypothetical protein